MGGKADNPIPLKYGDEIVKLRGCPDCEGRGWFLINPFVMGGSNGAGGISNMTQCRTCADAKAYYDQHQSLPPDLIERMTNAQNTVQGSH